jgi:hypothetical protein
MSGRSSPQVNDRTGLKNTKSTKGRDKIPAFFLFGFYGFSSDDANGDFQEPLHPVMRAAHKHDRKIIVM